MNRRIPFEAVLFLAIALMLSAQGCGTASNTDLDTLRSQVLHTVLQTDCLGNPLERYRFFSEQSQKKALKKMLTEMPEEGAFVPKQLLIKFKKDTSPAAIKTILVKNKAILHPSKQNLFPYERLWIKVDLPANLPMKKAISAYIAHPEVAWVQPNYIYRISAIPNDPEYHQQWGLNNEGQQIDDTFPLFGRAGMDINIAEAWDTITDCSPGLIAVIDTGINYHHEDLKNNMWNGSDVLGPDGTYCLHHGFDFVDNDNDPMDTNIHGTHVAGIIGAQGDNLTGMAGICWKAELMALRVCDSTGLCTTSDIAAGIHFAVANNVNVINLSLGGTNFDQIIYEAIAQARDKGIIFVASAGNSSSPSLGRNNDMVPEYPASFDLDNIISVTALTPEGELAGFSNFGALSVDVAAPGMAVLSTSAGMADDLHDDFSSGWIYIPAEGGWKRHPDCQTDRYSWPITMLTNPPEWCDCPDAGYHNNTEDLVYKTFDLSDVDTAYLSFTSLHHLELFKDYLQINYKRTGGNPFDNGSPLMAISGKTDDGLGKDYKIGLDDCLTEACALGFNLETDKSGTASGAALFFFKIETLKLFNNKYLYKTGTSMAAPHVTGLVSLLCTKYPKASYRDIIHAVYRSGRPLNSLSYKTCTGAMIDAAGALALLNEMMNP